MARKVFVKVKADFETDGRIRPLRITWEDGREFDIDAVTDVRRAASMAAGGSGIRYTCTIRNKPVFLYYENPKWFMEGKEGGAVKGCPRTPSPPSGSAPGRR